MKFTDEQIRRCRADFPSLRRAVNGRQLAFLDGPAGTQVPRQVIDAMSAYYTTSNANTHGAFVTSRESDAMVHAARDAAASFLGAPAASTISFGQNMTTLAFSLARAFGRLFQPGDEVVITELDHEANRGPWLDLASSGALVREVAVTRDGVLDYEDFAAKVNDRTKLIAIGAASNALGTVNDLARARDLARGAGAWLLVDAVHFAPHLPVDVVAIDADFLLCSAYKFYGPHVGILYTRPGLLDELPVDRLSTQEPGAPERIETGTLNHAALAGVKAAIEYLASWGEGASLRERILSARQSIHAHEHSLGLAYWGGLQSIPGVTAWGQDFASTMRAPTVSISIDGVAPSVVAQRLAEKAIAVWDGDFYARRPIEVLGLAERGGVVRAGVSMYNIREEIDRLLEAVEEIARG